MPPVLNSKAPDFFKKNQGWEIFTAYYLYPEIFTGRNKMFLGDFFFSLVVDLLTFLLGDSLIPLSHSFLA